MPFRQIYTTIWAESWFAPLPPTAKLLYLYLLTSDATRPTGVMERSVRRVGKDLGILEASLHEALSALNSHVHYFPESECFWVPKFPVWQGKGPKWFACVKNTIPSLPQDVRSAFTALYPNNTLYNTLCPTLPDTPSDTPSQSGVPTTLIRHKATLNTQQEPPIVPLLRGTHPKRRRNKELSPEERRQSMIRTEVKHPGLLQGLSEDMLAEASRVRAREE